MKVNPARNHLILWAAREAYVKWYVTGPSFIVFVAWLTMGRVFCSAYIVLLGVLASDRQTFRSDALIPIRCGL